MKINKLSADSLMLSQSTENAHLMLTNVAARKTNETTHTHTYVFQLSLCVQRATIASQTNQLRFNWLHAEPKGKESLRKE